MYLAILAKTDGKLGGFTVSKERAAKGITVRSDLIADDLLAGYFYSKNEIPEEYVEEMIVAIENIEHIQSIEIMKYIKR